MAAIFQTAELVYGYKCHNSSNLKWNKCNTLDRYYSLANLDFLKGLFRQ